MLVEAEAEAFGSASLIKSLHQGLQTLFAPRFLPTLTIIHFVHAFSVRRMYVLQYMHA